MKEQNEKKKRKRMDKDTAGVILILAILILAAVIAAFMGYHNTFEKISKAASKTQNNSENFQFTVEILLTCGFVAVFVICLIVLKKIKDRKRNALLLAKRLEQEQIACWKMFSAMRFAMQKNVYGKPTWIVSLKPDRIYSKREKGKNSFLPEP